MCLRLPIKILPSIVLRGVNLAARPIIVGVDPGATTGIAAVDFDGNLLFTKSKKNFQHSEISKTIYEHGVPIIMATDKCPLPKTVERISAAFPTKLSCPIQSLTRKEKNEMVFPYRVDGKRSWNNDHEKDALAAAIFAHNRVKPLMRRIRKKVPDEEANYVIMSVILKGRSIDQSLKEFNAGGQIIINEKKSLGKVRRKGPAKKAY